MCDTGEKDSLLHSLALCPGSRKSFESDSVTTEKILLLDISASVPLPHNDLPLVWFTGEVLRRIFFYRRDEKRCRLFKIRAEMEAKMNMARRSKIADMAVILDVMLECSVSSAVIGD